MKKKLFEKEKAVWLRELSSVIKNYTDTIHSSVKKNSVRASKLLNGNLVYSNLQDKSENHKPSFKLG